MPKKYKDQASEISFGILGKQISFGNVSVHLNNITKLYL